MTDQLICETAAERRAKDLLTIQDRIAKLEGKFDVLTTRLEYLARDAITADDLDKLEAKIMAAVDAKLAHICDHFDKGIERHSGDTKQAVKRLVRVAIRRAADEGAKTRRRVIHYSLVSLAIILTLMGKDGAFAVLRWASGQFGF